MRGRRPILALSILCAAQSLCFQRRLLLGSLLAPLPAARAPRTGLQMERSIEN